MRGSGPAGLAAMPLYRPFAGGYLARPLLEMGRDRLIDYLRQQGMEWIDDPSNELLDFDRNYLRHSVIPQLKARWPSVSNSVSRSAKLCGEANEFLNDCAQVKLRGHIAGDGSLDLAALCTANPAERRLLLRRWLLSQNGPLPNHRVMDRLAIEMLDAAADRRPQVDWAGVSVRRYRGRLHLLSEADYLPTPREAVYWSEGAVLALPGNGELRLQPGCGGLSLPQWQQSTIEVRYRQGGERLRPAGRGHGMDLKHLFQERGVPPWLRHRMPLIYLDNRLAVVPGCAIDEGFMAGPEEPSTEIRWSRWNGGGL
jgi:tRNA(Ile)-lysidine synthase